MLRQRSVSTGFVSNCATNPLKPIKSCLSVSSLITVVSLMPASLEDALVGGAIIQNDKPIMRGSARLTEIDLNGRKLRLKISIVMSVKLIAQIVAENSNSHSTLDVLQQPKRFDAHIVVDDEDALYRLAIDVDIGFICLGRMAVQNQKLFWVIVIGRSGQIQHIGRELRSADSIAHLGKDGV